MSTMTTDSSLLELVDLASHSPSGHNAQPWTVVRTGEHRLVLRSERDRWLTQVDPSNRELLLSFGALMETIRQAAPSTGYRADLHVVADRADTPEIAQVDLTPAPAVASTAPSLIRSRATTRTPFTPDEVPSKDVDSIVGLDRAALAFVPRQSSNGRWLADAATEAFAQQTWDDSKQAELARWLRFSRSDARALSDGLTPDALGLRTLAREVWYAAFTRKQAMRPSFRRSSIRGTERQLQGFAGFLLVTSRGRSVESLLDAGALYQRALLRATDLGIAHHTMSYALEEDPWRQEIDRTIGSEQPIQFMFASAKRGTLPARASDDQPPASSRVGWVNRPLDQRRYRRGRWRNS